MDENRHDILYHLFNTDFETGFGIENAVLMKEGWFVQKEDGLHFRRFATDLERTLASAITKARNGTVPVSR